VPTSTVEQYIKTIYLQFERLNRELLPMKQLADAMEVTPGTATSMVKHLSGLDLVRYLPRKGVRLTDRGSSLALKMVRRHRLIETFLEQTLGYDWGEVHQDAEQLEHAVSDKFIHRIDAFLGFPDTDPHGDPIPSEAGDIEAGDTVELNQCPPGSLIAICRVDNSDPDFLSMMKRHLVVPGEQFLLTECNETGGTLTLRHTDTGQCCTIGIELGGRIQVSSVSLHATP